ncbi:unnamed protein product [Gordionus sp. m RMFG-2023]
MHECNLPSKKLFFCMMLKNYKAIQDDIPILTQEAVVSENNYALIPFIQDDISIHTQEAVVIYLKSVLIQIATSKNSNQYQHKLKTQFTQTDKRIYVTNECQICDHVYNYLPNSLTTSLTGNHDYNYLPNSLTTSLTLQQKPMFYIVMKMKTMLCIVMKTHLSAIYEPEVINLTTNSTNYQEIQILFFKKNNGIKQPDSSTKPNYQYKKKQTK